MMEERLKQIFNMEKNEMFLIEQVEIKKEWIKKLDEAKINIGLFHYTMIPLFISSVLIFCAIFSGVNITTLILDA
jgi:hypothetical protein